LTNIIIEIFRDYRLPPNVLMSAKIEALGNPGRTRATHNGSARTLGFLNALS